MVPLSRVESILRSKENNEAYEVQPLSRLELQLMNLNTGGGVEEEIPEIKTEINNVKDAISSVAIDLDREVESVRLDVYDLRNDMSESDTTLNNHINNLRIDMEASDENIKQIAILAG